MSTYEQGKLCAVAEEPWRPATHNDVLDYSLLTLLSPSSKRGHLAQKERPSKSVH